MRAETSFLQRLGISRTHTLRGKDLSKTVGQGAAEEDNNPRSVSHFFDPVHSVPLEVPFPQLCARVFATAEEWALLPKEATLNFYSVPEAKKQYIAAVTGANPATREEGLRNLFLDLGHAVHLVQDMAQPEHTRNDQHLPNLYRTYGADTEASIWEEWGANNLVGTNGIPPAVSYDGYPNVVLRDYAEYFHTSDGKGMADFSNRWFVTQDTNYQDEKEIGKCQYYSEPKIEDASERVELVNENYRNAFGGIETELVKESIWTSFPMDNYAGTQETDPFHDLKSVIDFETRQKGAPTYSLNDASYLSRAALLVPRAVGYSAGFIDHFFRGSIAIKWQRGSEENKWDMKITNTSAERIGDDAMIESVLRVDPSYFGRTNSDDTAPILARKKIADYIAGFSGIEPGDTVTIANIQIADLIPGDSIRSFGRRTVITGTLGNESDAVIGLVQDGAPHKMRAEVSWTEADGWRDPGPAIIVDGRIVIGPAYSFYPNFCLTFEGAQACITQIPARAESATAVFTIDKVNPEHDYDFAFLNTQGGVADTTVKIYIDDELARTIHNPAVDLRYTGRLPIIGEYNP
jgi:hypothetical protein